VDRPRPLYERIARWIVVIAGLLALSHAVTQLSWRGRHAVPKALAPLFDMSSETSLLTWASVVTLAALGASAFYAGWLTRERAWHGAGALFTYLSLDDATQTHERVGWLFAPLFEGHAVYVWVIVLGPVFAALGGLVAWRLARVLRADPAARRRIVVGFACLALALALEMLEQPLHDAGLRWRGFPLPRYTIPLEEALELVGPGLCLAAVVGHLERWRARDLAGPRANEGTARRAA
jgi:hypothetical protein